MFRDITFRTRLMLGFSGVVAVFVVSLILLAFYLSNLVSNVKTIDDETVPLTVTVGDMSTAVSDVQQFLTDVSATHDDGGYKEAEDNAKTFRSGLEIFKRYYAAKGDATRLAQLETMAKNFDDFYAMGVKMAQTYVANGIEAGNLLMKGTGSSPGFDSAAEKLHESLDTFKEDQLALAKATTADAVGASRTMFMLLVAASVVGAAVGVGLGLLIVKVLMNQLGGEPLEANHFAYEIGKGNLAHKVPLRPGDTTSLLASLEQMRVNLFELIRRVRHTARELGNTSIELSKSSDDLAKRTESTALGLEDQSRAMSDMGSKVADTAERTATAAQYAHENADVANRGGKAIAAMLKTMGEIQDSSTKIADITTVIDSIAFQTNILALNAAVEAARAGESGRGFAVVASEVRALAQRTAEAAKEITRLIDTNVERINTGSTMMHEAGDTMNEVVASAQRINSLLDDITDSAKDQASGVNQMSQSLHKLDADTQQNAAVVEENSSVAEALTKQAELLMEHIARFRVV